MRKVLIAVWICLILLFAVLLERRPLAADVFSSWGAYGQIYEESTPGTDIDITDADTFYPWVSATPGVSRLTTPEATGITIGSQADGLYLVCMSFSYSGSANTTFHFEVFVDEASKSNVSAENQVGTANDVRDLAVCGLLALEEGQVVSVRVEASGASKTATINHGNLTITRVGVL